MLCGPQLAASHLLDNLPSLLLGLSQNRLLDLLLFVLVVNATYTANLVSFLNQVRRDRAHLNGTYDQYSYNLSELHQRCMRTAINF